MPPRTLILARVRRITLGAMVACLLAAPAHSDPLLFSTADLHSWIHSVNLNPDWLRIGTDIIGPQQQRDAAPTSDSVLSLSAQAIPEPATLLLLGAGLVILWWGLKRRR